MLMLQGCLSPAAPIGEGPGNGGLSGESRSGEGVGMRDGSPCRVTSSRRHPSIPRSCNRRGVRAKKLRACSPTGVQLTA
jgi:hypothetical protein